MVKVIVNPDIVVREEYDDWGLLYNPSTSETYGINPSGITIYKLLQDNRSMEDIVKALREQYINVPDDLTSTVNEFIEFL
ncbi:MAG: PqqD family peptide modification chaperone, partial [Candidatus Aegiribacteria sp.]|nr:PqqD family peptide modification chaperone [Candidatus Aegiribacteria sp.]